MIDSLKTGMIAAFTAGTISFLSPCVLPLVPGYVSYIAGQSIGGVPARLTPNLRFRTIALSLCFVLGFSTIFVILGASATALGRDLFPWARHSIPASGGIYRCFVGSSESDGTRGSPVPNACRRRHDRYGVRDDHRSTRDILLLAPECIPAVVSDRVNQGQDRGRVEIPDRISGGRS